MKCNSCGYDNRNQATFCSNCGGRLSTVAASRAAEQTLALSDGPHGAVGGASTDLRDPVTEPLAAGADRKRVVPQAPMPYKIITHIGTGGMGTVFLARDEKLDRFVAVKRLGNAFLNAPRMKERFFREAQSIAALSHAHIVQVYSLGEDERGPYIAMEYVSGPGTTEASSGLPPPPLNLEEKVQNGGVLPLDEAIALLRKLCDAMIYAHEAGIIHRDLKPSNVLIARSGEPKIADFGLARRAPGEKARLTMEGAKMLSLGYGAPEQESDAGEADARADIYALGGILYFCLTGDNPRFFRENKTPPSVLAPLVKAIAKDRDERWKSVKEFDRALAASGRSIPVYRPSTMETGTWRCKWCNTASPLENRHCSECGWDGLAICPECGVETRQGIRFCSTCGSDIKAFEEAQAVVASLKNQFDKKDYAHVAERAEGLRGFRARREAGRALIRQAAELRAKARRLLKQKALLGEAIAKEVEHQRYERAQELVHEHDAIDGAGAYVQLSAELPMLVCERDMAGLHKLLLQAKDFLRQGRITECRETTDAAVRLGRRLHEMVDQLKVASETEFLGRRNLLLEGMGRREEETSLLVSQLERIENEISLAINYVKVAFDEQDYDMCREKIRALRLLTTRHEEADEWGEKVSQRLTEISDHMRRASDLVRAKKWAEAEKVCRTVLTRFKHNQPDAQKMLARLMRRKSAIRFVTSAVILAAALVVYVLSIGPAFMLAGRDASRRASTRFEETFYSPVLWLYDHTALRPALRDYARLWSVDLDAGPGPQRNPGAGD